MLGALRLVGLLEGISYLILLGICMPLKYFWDTPEPTKPIGMAHGILFVMYCALVLKVAFEKRWKFEPIFWSLLASVLPFGTFVVDKKYFK